MPSYKQLSLTYLECKALWIIADVGYHADNPDLERDPDLESAAERALDKVYRADRNMPRRAHPAPAGGRQPGPPLRLSRAHRMFNCECPKCRSGAA